MYIILLRHGETEFNKLGKVQGAEVDPPLNSLGIKQSEVTGDFLKGSIIATIAWMTIWPSEAIKNHVQANKGSKMSVLRQASMLYQTQGLAGFYRGLLPGTMRSIFANGFSMVAFMQCQRWRIDPTEKEE